MRKMITVAALSMLLGLAGFALPQNSKNEQAALRKEAKISMRQAEKTALAKEPGKIKSKELEKENGKIIYSFDVQTKAGIHEVNVDAVTGEVVEDSVESPAAEQKEKMQEKKQGKTAKQSPSSQR
jgi:Peptidase propeptide and YPEB domain